MVVIWVGLGTPSGCDYTPGDANGDDNVMGDEWDQFYFI